MWLEGDTVASIVSSLKIQLSKDPKLSLLYSSQLQRSIIGIKAIAMLGRNYF